MMIMIIVMGLHIDGGQMNNIDKDVEVLIHEGSDSCVPRLCQYHMTSTTIISHLLYHQYDDNFTISSQYLL